MDFTSITGLVTEQVGDLAPFFDTSTFYASMIISFIFYSLVYIFSAIVYMKLAKKTRTNPAWFAWIPIANIYLIFKMARMRIWPLVVTVLLTIITLLSVSLIFISPWFGILVALIVIILIISLIAVFVLSIIAHYKIFMKLGKPGWWIIFMFAPMFSLSFSFVNMIFYYVIYYLSSLVILVLLAIAAFGKTEKKYEEAIKKEKIVENKSADIFFLIVGIISIIGIIFMIIGIGFVVFYYANLINFPVDYIPSILTQQNCIEAGGQWNECGSKCQLNNPGNSNVTCPAVCEKICECGTILGLGCPEGYSCITPIYIADARGYCSKDLV